MAKKKERLPSYTRSKLVDNFTPKTEAQEKLVELIEEKEIVIVKGSPGTGKSYVTLAAALNLLGSVYKQIVLVKSLVTVPEESVGYLPGEIEDKMDPYLMSYM